MPNPDDTTTPNRSTNTTDPVDPTRCATCGVVVDAADWHPVATELDADDEFHVYAFCSEDCRTEWRED